MDEAAHTIGTTTQQYVEKCLMSILNKLDNASDNLQMATQTAREVTGEVNKAVEKLQHMKKMKPTMQQWTEEHMQQHTKVVFHYLTQATWWKKMQEIAKYWLTKSCMWSKTIQIPWQSENSSPKLMKPWNNLVKPLTWKLHLHWSKKTGEQWSSIWHEHAWHHKMGTPTQMCLQREVRGHSNHQRTICLSNHWICTHPLHARWTCRAQENWRWLKTTCQHPHKYKMDKANT